MKTAPTALVLPGPAEVLFLGPEAIMEHRAFWNDLWERTSVSWPMARAEQVDLWLKTFGQGKAFGFVVVTVRGKWILSLPLIHHSKRGRSGSIAGLPGGEWTSFGAELMVDTNECKTHHWQLLIDNLYRSPWKVLWLEHVRVNEPRWVDFAAALRKAGWNVKTTPGIAYGLTQTQGDWAAYEKSRRETSSRKRHAKRLMQKGTVEFTVHQPIQASEAIELTNQVFEVEHRSWKGPAGTSVIAAGFLEFYQKMAVDLARHSELEISFLRLNGQPIAAQFASVARGVCHTIKIGYDEAYRDCSPGNLLIQSHLEQAFRNPSYAMVDDVGPLCSYTQIWCTQSYQVGEFVAYRPYKGGAWPHARQRLKAAWMKLRNKLSRKKEA